ncbi:MAG TPA: hypothetical protein VFC39_13040 [Acidobacteriaceae bacterium]|nr:hypothetical protein [Acidobacteriaceae bacterium]
MKFPKHADLWFPAYLLDRARNLIPRPPAKRLWVAITDHYEPWGGGVSAQVAANRVAAWRDRWPSIASEAPADATGRQPCYTFFYPQEEYEVSTLNALAELSRNGTADVEVHIHHENDTAASFTEKIRTFCSQLHDGHGLLHHHNGRLVFGFIHGNWALGNSLPGGRGCGVTGELQLLRDLGCYADFTMPSLPSASQSRIINKIYWATGDPQKPRAFDTGIEATVGGGAQDGLLMITGPAGLHYKKNRLMPWLEAGELAAHAEPIAYRVKRWLDLAPRLGDDIFLKLFAHGAREDNAAVLLGNDSRPGTLGPMFRWISEAAQRHNLELHWTSAFDMFQAVDALIQPEKVHP